jgi:hypothetical protein
MVDLYYYASYIIIGTLVSIFAFMGLIVYWLWQIWKMPDTVPVSPIVGYRTYEPVEITFGRLTYERMTEQAIDYIDSITDDFYDDIGGEVA